jgi:hypothetical protein
MSNLKELSDKISSFNIFNYLLPGILFVVIAKELTGMDLILTRHLLGVFFYYFIGMVICLFGSLVIEPLLQRVNFIKFIDYRSFLLAARNDDQLELLSHINNIYQSMVSMSVLLIIMKAYSYVKYALAIPNSISIIFALIGIIVLFLFSYRKQAMHIAKRIEINNQYL